MRGAPSSRATLSRYLEQEQHVNVREPILSLEYDLCRRGFTVGCLPRGRPHSILEVFGFDQVRPIPPQFELGPHFGYAASIAADDFVGYDFAVLDTHRPLGRELGGGE